MRFSSLRRSFAALLLAGACAGSPAPEPVEDALARVDLNLERLQALEVMTVGDLVLDVPDEAVSCYGTCPGWEEEVAAARQRSAERLEHMAAIAEEAVATPSGDDACAQEAIDANLAVLRDLGIVEIGQLLVEQPVASPDCYNLPCPGEEERAREVTCERARKLDAIVAACSYL
jgi:hypothetical protein